MKTLFLIATLLATGTAYAQTDEFNLKKYWKFRNTFVEQFVKIGPEYGESLPAGKRKPCNCVDNLYLNPQGIPDCYGEMHWGDGMIRHGHYIGFLATEYALLKKYNQDVTATLHELYYALAAINRVDINAEDELDQVYGMPGFYGPELNGFYLREDIPEDFASEFSDGDWDMKCTNSAFYHNNNAAKVHDPSSPYGFEVKGLSYINVPSLDQMSSLLVGLSVAHKLVDNVFVEPTTSDQGFYLKTEIENITDRIVRYAADHNWQLIDVNGWPVANGGGDLAFTAYPIFKAAQHITGNTYPEEITRRYLATGKLQHCVTGFGVDNNDPQGQADACTTLGSIQQNVVLNTLGDGVPAGIDNNQDESVFQSWQSSASLGGASVTGAQIDYDLSENIWKFDLPDAYPVAAADWEDDSQFSIAPFPLNLFTFENLQLFAHFNTLICFNLGVVSRDWSQSQAHNFANIGDNRQLELVNALLRDEQPIEDKAFYKAYLDQMPISGSYFLSGRSGSAKDSLFTTGWATDYRWARYLNDNLGNANDENGHGVFNGMDYMYFHNLYYLFFGDQINDPFEKKYDCFCNAAPQKPLGGSVAQTLATINLNKKLDYVGSCVENVFAPVNNDVYGSFAIEPFFFEYINAGIRPSKYQTENATIHSGADVQVQTDFVICGNKTLTTEANSELVLSNGHLIVKNFSTLDVSGTVRIKAGNRIDFDLNGKIILRSGAKLIIEDEGKFLLNDWSILEFYDGAQIIMEGANSEFILRGGVFMMDGGTFTLDHSASTESGRLIVENYNGFGRGVGNTNPCFVELYGKDANDEFVIFKKDAGFVLHNSNAPSYIDKLTIHHCKVRFEENAKIVSHQPFIAYQTTFESDENNEGIMVGDYNNFSSCNFYDVPVKADLFVENTAKFRATNCKFWSKSDINEQDRPLVYVNGMGFNIHSCEFKGSEHACLRSENLLHISAISSSTFEHYDGYTSGTQMVGIHDVSNVEVKLISNTIGQMNYGVTKVGGKLSLRCNTFAYNIERHVLGAFGCHVNLSTDLGAGYNQFYQDPDVCIQLQSAMISMGNGRNRFHDFQYYVQGDVISQCGVNTDCAIDASKNQWSPNYIITPLQSKFDVVGSDNLPYQFSANLTQAMPPCGYYDSGDPGQGSGEPEYPTAGENNYVENESMINLSFNPDISLSEAVQYADRLSNVGQDLEAVNVYDEIFDLNLSKDEYTSKWMYRALSGMKSSLENAMFEETLLKEDNLIVFEQHVQAYVDALNYMSDMSIQNDNYKEQFYLEVEKSHLYRMLEIDQMSNEVLSHIDVCGLDEDEQVMLNYWKRQYEIDLIVNQIGYAYIDSTIAVDTSGYNTPTSYTPPIFNFGSQINGVYNVSYTSCASGNAKMNALANLPMNELNVHPNPANQFIEVQFDFGEIDGEADIVITSMEGKEVARMNHDFETKGNYLSLDVSNWEQGGYLITAKTTSLGTLRKQFVVTH